LNDVLTFCLVKWADGCGCVQLLFLVVVVGKWQGNTHLRVGSVDISGEVSKISPALQSRKAQKSEID
jgi:hypothetical protein